MKRDMTGQKIEEALRAQAADARLRGGLVGFEQTRVHGLDDARRGNGDLLQMAAAVASSGAEPQPWNLGLQLRGDGVEVKR